VVAKVGAEVVAQALSPAAVLASNGRKCCALHKKYLRIESKLNPEPAKAGKALANDRFFSAPAYLQEMK
jgi:hypothetical protein